SCPRKGPSPPDSRQRIAGSREPPIARRQRTPGSSREARMRIRHLPVRPSLEHLRRQAKSLLHSLHAGDPSAVAELRELHPDSIDPEEARLADAQLVLARSYLAPSWPRLVQAVKLANAIWEDDLRAIRE